MAIGENAGRLAGLNLVAEYLAVVYGLSPDTEKLIQGKVSNGVGFYMNGA